MMHYKRFLLIALTTFITTSLQSGAILPGILPARQVWAQTPDTRRKGEAHKLYVEAILQVQNNQTQAAIKSFQQALIIFRDIKDRKSEGVVLSDLGLAYYILKDYPKAINYYKQSLVIAKEIKNSKLESIVKSRLYEAQIKSNPQKIKADNLFKQGNQYAQTNQLEAAIQSFQKALTIYREIKDIRGEMIALAGLGTVYNILQDNPKAINYYKQALVIARKIQNPKLEAQIQQALKNLEISRSHPQKTEADKLVNQGIKQFKTSQFKTALQSFQQALVIYREIKDRKGEGTVLGNLGLIYRNLGDYPKAIDYQKQSLAIMRETKNRKGEGQSLGNLGLVYQFLGDYPKAIEYHNQSLAIARETNNRKGEGTVLVNLGNAYLYKEDTVKAIDYYNPFLSLS